LSFIAVLIAVPLLLLLLPYLNKITSAEVPLSLWSDYHLWLLLAGIVTVTGLLAGSYPAFYLSNFRAVRVLKGNFTNHISAAGIRRSLVVFQFVLSILLISGIIVVYSQMNYIKNKDLGFDKEQRLIFNFHTEETVKNIPAFMNGLRSVAGVQEVSNASKYLSSPAFYSNSFFLRHQQDAEAKTANFIITDEHFVKANGIRLISGRNFTSTDSAKVLINETFAKQLGLDPLSAPGTLVYDNQSRVEEVIGVMKDFNFNSLHKNVEGFLLWKTQKVEDSWPTVIAHVSSTNYQKTLADIAAIWSKAQPNTPFSYTFLDKEVDKQYEAEITVGRIINSFTLMAILISCLGLFGLAAFNAEQRAKEIGVRKVLGAGTRGIVSLLSKDFLKLVIIAFAIATPIAWWSMDQWLQNFAYRVSISWWMFGLAGSVAMIIAFSTVCFQAMKAAVENPVKSLRSE
jgi:putative ABC transport system permease protein